MLPFGDEGVYVFRSERSGSHMAEAERLKFVGESLEDAFSLGPEYRNCRRDGDGRVSVGRSSAV